MENSQQLNNPSSAPPSNLCQLCQKPLTVTEYEIWHRWTIRLGCRICGQSDKSDIHTKSENLTDIPDFHDFELMSKPCHPSCFSEDERISIQSESVPIPRATLDKLNQCRRLCGYGSIENSDLSEKTLQQIGSLESDKWIVDMNFEQIYRHLHYMEGVCSSLSLALSRHRKAGTAGKIERESNKLQAVAAQRSKINQPIHDLAHYKEKALNKKISKAAKLLVETGGYTLEEAEEFLKSRAKR